MNLLEAEALAWYVGVGALEREGGYEPTTMTAVVMYEQRYEPRLKTRREIFGVGSFCQKRVMAVLLVPFIVSMAAAAAVPVAESSAVVRIEVAGVSPNYLRPWEKVAQHKKLGSGFLVEGGRLLTNFHVIEDAVDIAPRSIRSLPLTMIGFPERYL